MSRRRHGGARKGAGRPADHASGRKQPVTVSLSPAAHRALWEKANADHGGNRSAAVEALVLVDDAKTG